MKFIAQIFLAFMMAAHAVLAMDSEKQALDFDYGKKDKLLPLFLYDGNGDCAVSYYYGTQFALTLWSINRQSNMPEMVHKTDEMVSLVAINVSGTHIITATDQALSLWQINGNKLEKITTHTLPYRVAALSLSHDGLKLVIEDLAGHLSVFEINENKFEIIAQQEQKRAGLFTTLLGESSSNSKRTPSKIAIHPQGDAFIVGTDSGDINSYLIVGQKIVELPKTLVFEGQRINGIMFASERTVLVQAVNGAIESWEWSNGILSKPQVLRSGSQTETKCFTPARFSISRDGQKVISRDRDGTIILWTLRQIGWTRAQELCHPQQSGYQDAFFSNGVPMLWNVEKEWARAITKY